MKTLNQTDAAHVSGGKYKRSDAPPEAVELTKLYYQLNRDEPAQVADIANVCGHFGELLSKLF